MYTHTNTIWCRAVCYITQSTSFPRRHFCVFRGRGMQELKLVDLSGNRRRCNEFLERICVLFDSGRNFESSTNTATRAATEESTPGSRSAAAHDFRATEQYRWRSAADKITPAAKYRQQGECVFPRQPVAVRHAVERYSARGEIPILSGKLVAEFS